MWKPWESKTLKTIAKWSPVGIAAQGINAGIKAGSDQQPNGYQTPTESGNPLGGRTPATAQPGTAADAAKAQAYRQSLLDKRARGEQLTAAEASYLEGKISPTPATTDSGKFGLDPTPDLRDLRDRFLQERGGANQPPPVIDRTQSDEVRGLQLGQAQNLQDVALGRVPSVADAQRQAAMLDVTQNVLGQAAGARGADGGGARRMAARQISENGRRVGIDAALVKAQEVSQANAQLGQLLGQTRGADVSLATTDVNAGLQNRGLNIEQSIGLGKLALDAQTTESTTALQQAQIRNMQDQLQFAYDQLAQARDEADRQFWGSRIDALVGALGATGAAKATS